MGRLIFETVINFAETFIITVFYTIYLGSKYDDKRKYLFFCTAWLIEFVEICIVNEITSFETFGAYIPIVIYFIYGMLCLKGSMLLKLWMAIITHIIVVMVAVVSNLGICWIIGYDPNEMITVFNNVRIISVIISKIILCVCYYIILKNRYKNPIKNYLWYILIIIPLFSVISVSELMNVALIHIDVDGYVLIGMLCIVVSNILIYYFYTVISREFENRLKVNLLEQQNENAKQSIKNTEAFVDKMRSVKHDIKNQFYTILCYIDMNQIDEAKEYIKNLTEDYLPTVRNFSTTENIAFDAIINSKLAICEQKKIYMEIKVMQGCLLNFNYVDVGVLFGNLLDNAIEAASKTEEKRISVEVQKKGGYLTVLVCNSVNGSVLKDNSSLETTKENKDVHGIGIKSIKEVVKKYDGMIQFYEENGKFCCYILMDISE